MGVVINAGTKDLSLQEASIVEIYRQYGLAGLVEMALSNYQAEQKDIIYVLNQRIEELEQEITIMREPIIDWTNTKKGST